MRITLFFLLALSFNLGAQNKIQQWQLNAGMTGHKFMDQSMSVTQNLTDFNRLNLGVPLNYLSLSRHLFGGISPELKFTGNKIALDPTAASAKTLMANGMFNLKYSLANGYLFSTNSFFEPFLKGGVGMTYMDHVDNDKFMPTYDFGGGLAFWFGSQKNFGIQIQQMYHMIPMFGAPNNTRDYFEYSASLGYKFGMKDKDKDGIPDQKDECPDEKGMANMKGCPDKDLDGIADKNDRCPENAGAKEFEGCPDRDGDSIPDIDDKCPDNSGLIYLKGCPDRDGDSIPDYQDSCASIKGLRQFRGCPDRDKDNIEDRLDKCPDVPGLAQFKGCPDTDNDGIPDPEDKCPREPGPPRNQGCPEDANKDALNERLAFHAKSIFFATNKFEILSKSFPMLEEIAKIIIENPNEQFVIEGHTDVTGNEAKNLQLSKDRANAVKEFLISQGVPRNVVESEGFGIKYPLSLNNSKLGRAQNRRVDVTVKR
jgi:outer membrane protein OmpA-like peptidoglycan-associated protein